MIESSWLLMTEHRPVVGQLAVVLTKRYDLVVVNWSDEKMFGYDGIWWNRLRGRWFAAEAVSHWTPLPEQPDGLPSAVCLASDAHRN